MLANSFPRFYLAALDVMREEAYDKINNLFHKAIMHDPDTDTMDAKRVIEDWYQMFSFEYLYDDVWKKRMKKIVVKMLVNWCKNEYGYNPPFEEAPDGDISIAYTELGPNNEYPVNVYINFDKLYVKYKMRVNGKRVSWIEKEFKTIYHLRDFAEWLDYNEMLVPFYEKLEEMGLES